MTSRWQTRQWTHHRGGLGAGQTQGRRKSEIGGTLPSRRLRLERSEVRCGAPQGTADDRMFRQRASSPRFRRDSCRPLISWRVCLAGSFLRRSGRGEQDESGQPNAGMEECVGSRRQTSGSNNETRAHARTRPRIERDSRPRIWNLTPVRAPTGESRLSRNVGQPNEVIGD